MIMKTVDGPCDGVKASTSVSGFMAETAVSLISDEPIIPERQETIRQFMTQHNVGFIGEFNPTPHAVAYECVLDCSQCLGRVAMSASCEIVEVQLPPECPNS